MTARRRATRLSLALAAWGLALLATPGAAGAATLEQQGWWYRLQTSVLPTEASPRPDVGEGQLLVEGAIDGPTAISAVRFRLDDGESNPVLTVEVASHTGSPSTTVLLACKPVSRWQPAAGGAWENRPFPDCTTSVEGTLSDDGTTWSFPVTLLAVNDVVDAVLVPGKVPNGPDPVSGSVFRLVLENPALTTTVAPPVAASGGGSSAPPLSGAGSASGRAPSFTPPAPSSFTPPAAAPTASTTVPGDEVAAPAPQTAPATPVSTSPEDRPRWLGFLVMAAAVATAFAADRLPAAGRGGAAGGDREETVGGLGRFARPRTGPPPRLV